MANMVLSLLSSAWFPLDLSAHQDALLLAGNLLAGEMLISSYHTTALGEACVTLQTIRHVQDFISPVDNIT